MEVIDGHTNDLGTIEEVSDVSSYDQNSRRESVASNTGLDLKNDVFVYRTNEASGAHKHGGNGGPEEGDDEEDFVYPGGAGTSEPMRPDPVPIVDFTPPEPLAPPARASASQLESVYNAASSGNLLQLQRLFESVRDETGIEAFALANDATSRTGLTPLHATASRGHTELVKWLIQHCGAMADLEDKEGETALHKAALNGHLDVVATLLSPNVGHADVHAQDADGWTALHNAASKGYLDIVKYLCEKAGAADVIPSQEDLRIRGVDAKSKAGWTPLMNAASKGHLPVVLYLLSKQSADPLVRNNLQGETAFDAAAAVFEIWICQVLQRAEMERWQGCPTPYNPLSVHTTIPLILYEHQRLDTRLKTLAVNGGRPKFSAYHLGHKGRRSPFELNIFWEDQSNNGKAIPAWRSDVQLPYLEEPFVLPKLSGNKDVNLREGAERSHFWLSDWTLDLTHPKVDVEEGWQYARTLDDPEEKWTAEPPAHIQQLLASSTLSGLTSPGPSRLSIGGSPQGGSAIWARRRRWVRVMRRRLDISPLPFMEPDGAMYQFSLEGSLVPFAGRLGGDSEDGQELGSVPFASMSSAQDYVARARFIVGSQPSVFNSSRIDGSVDLPSPAELRKAIAKLERAVDELRSGVLSDDDVERRTQAEVLLNTYSRELERTRLTAGANGLLRFQTPEADEDSDNGSDEDSFHYPSSPTSTARPASIRSHTTDYFTSSIPSGSRDPSDIAPHLLQSPEFRVPTHESPQKVLSPGWTAPTAHSLHAQWERDEIVAECRSCKRRFNFILRRHCRKCGRVFCNACSSFRELLDPVDIVQDPMVPEHPHAPSTQRVCQTCHDEIHANVPSRLRGSRAISAEGILVDQRNLSVPGHSRGEASSQISDLADCPVCGQNLADLGTPAMQESHVKSCLEGGGSGSRPGGATQGAKYLVYKLPPESVLIGNECVICLEEFVKGSLVARLSCLCTFHNPCLSAWLQRGRSCPVHARDT